MLAKKEQIKRILGRSPDYSDSVAMAVYGLSFGLPKRSPFDNIGSRRVVAKKKEKPKWLNL